MDQLFIKGLQTQTLIGVYAQEREAATPILVDLQVDLDLRPAGESDVLAQSVDYAQLVAIIHEHAAATAFQLLESWGESLCKTLFARFPAIKQISLALSKPGILPGLEAVGVKLLRQRQARG